MRSPIAAELRQLVRLAGPIAAAQAGLALMGLVDTAVVGRTGAGPLGAVGLGNGLFFSIAVLGMGLMMGLDPLISQAIGAGDRLRARRLLWQGTWLALLASVVLAVPVLLAELLVGLSGVEPEVAADARAFMLGRLPGLFPMLLFIGVRSYLQALGVVRPMIVATVAANLFNLAADIYFVFGGSVLPPWAGSFLRSMPALGAAGAAIATSLCTVVQLAVLVVAARRLRLPAAPAGLRRANRADLLRAVRLGLPIGLQLFAEVGVFALVGLLAGRLGRDALAAHQVALALSSFTFCAAVGVGQAGSVRVGWAIGARDTPAARLSGLTAFGLGAAFMALCGVALFAVPEPLVRLLSDRPEVIAATVPLLAVAAVFQVFDGVQAVGAGVLRGAGDTRFAFVANVVGHYGVGLPVALALGFGLGRGVFGLWWGLCAGLAAVAAALLGRFVVRSRRAIAPLEELQPIGSR